MKKENNICSECGGKGYVLVNEYIGNLQGRQDCKSCKPMTPQDQREQKLREEAAEIYPIKDWMSVSDHNVQLQLRQARVEGIKSQAAAEYWGVEKEKIKQLKGMCEDHELGQLEASRKENR